MTEEKQPQFPSYQPQGLQMAHPKQSGWLMKALKAHLPKPRKSTVHIKTKKWKKRINYY